MKKHPFKIQTGDILYKVYTDNPVIIKLTVLSIFLEDFISSVRPIINCSRHLNNIDLGNKDFEMNDILQCYDTYELAEAALKQKLNLSAKSALSSETDFTVA